MLIGGRGAPAQALWASVVCHAASRGVAVVAAADPRLLDAAAPPLPLAADWLAAGAQVSVAALPAPETSAETPQAREAECAAIADRLRTLAATGARLVALVSEEDASRSRVGLSGATWSPVGVQLDAAGVLSVRADAIVGAAPRVAVGPLEDVPERGAARRYDAVADTPA